MKPNFKLISDATVDLKTAAGVTEVALTDIDSLNQGTEIRIKTISPFNGYFYAVLLDADDNGVTALFPVGDSLMPVSAGQNVFIDWTETSRAGQLRLVVSPKPVASSDWPTLRGRDGDAPHTKASSGITDDTSDSQSLDS